MAKTDRQMNWTAVSHATVPITGVTSVRFSQGGKLTVASADADKFPTLAVAAMNNPVASVDVINPAAVMAIAPGTSGPFTATHNDAKMATGGGVVYVLDPAVAENADTAGTHAAIGTGSINFVGISADGSTNPLSFTRL